MAETTFCGNCFAKDHKTTSCIEKWDLFLPRIDDNLLPRFLQFFDTPQKYSMALKCQKALNLIMPSLKPLIIMKDFVLQLDTEYPEDSQVVINGSINISRGYPPEIYHKLFSAISSKLVIVKARDVTVYRIFTNGENLLHLLTPFTKSIRFEKISLGSDLRLKDIIRAAPNVQSIHIQDGEIYMSDYWAQCLLAYKQGSDFRYLHISNDEYALLEFNFVAIHKFMTQKSVKDVSININLYSTVQERLRSSENFADYFTPYPEDQVGLPKLTIDYGESFPKEAFTLAQLKPKVSEYEYDYYS